MNDLRVFMTADRVATGYRGHVVAREISLEIRSGERWFFLGANGSGKTTLMRTLLGLIPPLAGKVAHAGGQLDRSRIGFVPQRIETSPALPTTVGEFVRLGLVGARRAAGTERTRVAHALATVDLADRESFSLWTLSGGQRQRASLARALVREPDVLLLDEPTAGLDVASEDAFLRLLVELSRERGMTLVIVTHDADVARELATHAALFAPQGVVAGSLDDARVRASLDAYTDASRHRLATPPIEVAPHEGQLR
jgi:ABC-type Mn2+/Zn2+ transport system ATPase subunit